MFGLNDPRWRSTSISQADLLLCIPAALLLQGVLCASKVSRQRSPVAGELSNKRLYLPLHRGGQVSFIYRIVHWNLFSLSLGVRARVCMCVWAWLVRKESVCLFDNDESKWQLFMLSMDTDVMLGVRDLYVFLGPC